MVKRIKIYCDIGEVTCKDSELKFTEYGIMIDSSEEEIFIPYGSLQLAISKKNKGKSYNIKLQKYKEDKDCV